MLRHKIIKANKNIDQRPCNTRQLFVVLSNFYINIVLETSDQFIQLTNSKKYFKMIALNNYWYKALTATEFVKKGSLSNFSHPESRSVFRADVPKMLSLRKPNLILSG